MATKKKSKKLNRSGGRTGTTGRKGRQKRTTEQILIDLEARVAEVRERARGLTQFSPDKVRSDRDRLELTAADYAALVGVSPLTIYNWEKGRSRPRTSQLESWLQVRQMSKREAWRMLEQGLV